ncbi:MAG: rhodanese-like domain-containing protein [Candidatus Competibacteraceae bacterium]|nr:rhodanese-like domain-containing protein [Candidatus Competibacteraceae bacterium]
MKISELISQAEAEIETLSVDQVSALLNDDDTVIVDLRDVRELWREGKIPGALHAPRGMLEFWMAPDSPYHRDIFASGKRFVFYCAMGWRSALATQTAQRMGLQPVCHIQGGFKAWTEAGQPVETVEKK